MLFCLSYIATFSTQGMPIIDIHNSHTLIQSLIVGAHVCKVMAPTIAQNDQYVVVFLIQPHLALKECRQPQLLHTNPIFDSWGTCVQSYSPKYNTQRSLQPEEICVGKNIATLFTQCLATASTLQEHLTSIQTQPQ